MLQWLAGSSIRMRMLVLPVALALIGLGVFQMSRSPVDVLPEYAQPTIQVQTEALGLAATEVEQLITAPLEANLLNGVAWLDSIDSRSVTGLSTIDMVFERGTDLYRARQMVQERLTQARALPHVSKAPAMIQPLSATGRVLMVGLSSPDMSLIDMSVLTRFTIRPKLMGVPGVADVVVFGQRERQLQVHVDPTRLAERGVTLDQVVSTTGNALFVSPLTFLEASAPGAGGFIDTPNQRVDVQHLLPIDSPAELSKVTVEGVPGGALQLGDVADVVEQHQPLIGDAVVNDSPSLMLVIEKFPGADARTITRDVEAALSALRPGLGSIEVDTTVFRPATFIEDATDNVVLAWAAGLLLGLGLVVGLFRAWRLALVYVVTIPLSLLAALGVLTWRGTTVSAVVLVGLAVGLVVVIDEAVVGVESARRRRGTRPVSSLAEAMTAGRGPLLIATCILLVLPLPVLLTGDTHAAFFGSLVVSYALTVLAALLVAVTVTPALLSLLASRNPGPATTPPVAAALDRSYRRALMPALTRRRWVVGGLALGIAAGLAVLPQLGGQPVLPPMQDRDLLVHWEGAPGTSRPEMSRITVRAGRELRDVPGVREVGAHVGRAVAGDQFTGVSAGEMWVTLHSSADYAETTSAVRRVLNGYPGLVHRVETYPQARVRQIEDPRSGDVTVRVYGQQPDVLRTEAARVRQLVAGVDGVSTATLDLPTEEPAVEVEVDLAKAQRYGVKPGDVRRAATTLVQGVEVGSLFEQQKVFDVVVAGAPGVRHSPQGLSGLLIQTPLRGQVPLGDLASVEIVPARSVIQREAISPYLDIAATVTGRSAADVASEVEDRLQQYDFPVEYHAEVLRDPGAGGVPTYAYVLAVLTVVFLLLQAATGSWVLAGALLAALPISLTGALLAAEVNGGVTALSSFAALLAVLALSTRWLLLLVADLPRRDDLAPRSHDDTTTFRDLVSRCCAERLPGTLLSALLVAAAMLPFAVLGGRPGIETVQPIAVMVLGGLVTSLALVLFAVPAIYLWCAPARAVDAGDPTDVPSQRIDLTQPSVPIQEVDR